MTYAKKPQVLVKRKSAVVVRRVCATVVPRSLRRIFDPLTPLLPKVSIVFSKSTSRNVYPPA